MTRAGLATIANKIANPLVAANVPQNIAVTSDPKQEHVFFLNLRF